MNKHFAVAACVATLLQSSISNAAVDALNVPYLGLYPSSALKIADGNCKDCGPIKQALWYFEEEPIAIANDARKIAGYSTTERAQADVATWLKTVTNDDLSALPAAIWLGSRQMIPSARLSVDHKNIIGDDGIEMAFNVVPKIPTNLSYLNQSSWDFYAQRPLSMRGELNTHNQFIAKTIWPLDYNIGSESPYHPLAASESLKQLVQSDHGGAQKPYTTRVLWESAPGQERNWSDKAVIGVMLNGAQGDDDEAHGGHFAILTGQYTADGNWSQWLVNNFYNLDAYGEKGIIAAVTPADKYLMDLNSGQSLYRPSYMIVAIMKDKQSALTYQAASNRVYQHFYRHDLIYDHAQANCAGISIDTFRTLGWNIPKTGPEGYLKAIAAWFYVSITERSITSGRDIYDYLTEEKTRLYPAVAFDAIGNDLLSLVQRQSSRQLTAYEQKLVENIEAIIYVHIPQVPSERAYGLAPVYSFDQYLAETPKDKSQWKIIPTQPRPFPDEMRDGLATEKAFRSPIPLPVLLSFALLVGLFWLIFRLIKRLFF